jgi:hypothetical protein
VERIRNDVKARFGVNFPIFDKISVKGGDTHPLYRGTSGRRCCFLHSPAACARARPSGLHVFVGCRRVVDVWALSFPVCVHVDFSNRQRSRHGRPWWAARRRPAGTSRSSSLDRTAPPSATTSLAL